MRTASVSKSLTGSALAVLVVNRDSISLPIKIDLADFASKVSKASWYRYQEDSLPLDAASIPSSGTLDLEGTQLSHALTPFSFTVYEFIPKTQEENPSSESQSNTGEALEEFLLEDATTDASIDGYSINDDAAVVDQTEQIEKFSSIGGGCGCGSQTKTPRLGHLIFMGFIAIWITWRKYPFV